MVPVHANGKVLTLRADKRYAYHPATTPESKEKWLSAWGAA
jgi:hypothetical protein